MADSYYDKDHLAQFADIQQNRPELGEKFFQYYGAVMGEGVLSSREKSLMALAVAHAIKCPYCIEAYSRKALEVGADLDQMTEAAHVATAILGGACLIHGMQMRQHHDSISM